MLKVFSPNIRRKFWPRERASDSWPKSGTKAEVSFLGPQVYASLEITSCTCDAFRLRRVLPKSLREKVLFSWFKISFNINSIFR